MLIISQVRLACALVADMTIAATMLEFLYSAKIKMLRTQTVISRLIRVVFETGLILMLVAIVDLVMFVVFPSDVFFYVPSMTLAKLYSNAMLVVSVLSVKSLSTANSSYHFRCSMSGWILLAVARSPCIRVFTCLASRSQCRCTPFLFRRSPRCRKTN